MRRLSYLMAILCGFLALIASVYTILYVTGDVFSGKEFAYYVITRGWGGVVLSIALMTVSAWALGECSRLSSVYVSSTAFTGALLGGTLPISGLLIVAFVGGLFGMFTNDRAGAPSRSRPAR